jgi:hypothetical protein
MATATRRRSDTVLGLDRFAVDVDRLRATALKTEKPVTRIAREAHLDPSTLFAFFERRRDLSVLQLSRLAKYLDLDWRDLLVEKESR